MDFIASAIARAIPQALGVETKVPAIPAVTEANVSSVLRQVKHLLDVREGKAGDLMDANVTFRDLVESGLAIKPRWSSPSAPVAPPYIAPDGYNPATDFTPPTAPANVVAAGGIGTIILQWDTPAYRNHSYAEVWRAETNALGNAVLLGTSDTRFYTDAIGSGVTRYYWVRFVSLANVTGPYQGVDGIVGTTGQDPAYLIDLLQGQLGITELNNALTTRIGLIDAPDTVVGSVNFRLAQEASARAQGLVNEATARAEAFAQEVEDRQAAILNESTARTLAIAQEAQARAAAISAETIARSDAINQEAQARSSGLLEEAAARQAAIQTESATRQSAVESLSSQITTLTASVTSQGNTLSAAIQSESAARATAVSAEASARDTLAVQVRGGYSGNDISQVTSGLLFSERTARVTAVEALQSQINTLVAASSGDFQDLYASITEEQLARISGDTANANSIGTLVARLNNLRDANGALTNKSIEATIADNRSAQVTADAALSSQLTSLSSTVTNNFSTLNSAITNEASTRTTAISTEAAQRQSLASQMRGNYTGSDLAQVTSGLIFSERSSRLAADQSLQSQINLLSAASTGNFQDLLSSVQEEQEARVEGDEAQALARETLAAQLRGNYTGTDVALLTQGLLFNERQARVSGDQALTTQINTLSASFTTQVQGLSAAITQEQTARANAISSEASQRELLQSRLLGDYAGNDVAQLTSGMLFQERQTRTQADTALSQQIALISANVGDQFDYSEIWYFDTSIEGWVGNGTPTVSAGWLRPANSTTDPYVISPTGLAVNADRYNQVRLRVRKFGNPTWGGIVWWRSPSDSTWVGGRSSALTEPTYDANGIGLITVTPTWSGTIDVIRIDLSTAQNATDYFEIDWVAIGRPSPGASSAALAEESAARATADAAQVTARQALQTQLVGNYTGTDVAQVTSGILFSERQARSAADSALSTQISSLSSTVTSNQAALNAAIASEQTTRASADTAITNSINTLTATVASNRASAEAGIQAEASARATAIASEASERNQLSTQMRGTYTGTDVTQLTAGLIFSERQARSSADSALSTSITQLSSTVTGNFNTLNSSITAEATTRAAGDATLTTSINTLTSTVTGNFNTLNSAIQTESSTRTSAVNSLSNQLTTLQSTVTNNNSTLTAAIQSEASTRASIDGGLLAQFTIKADVNGYVSGFGLASTANNAAATSEFQVRADIFKIASPTGPGIAPAQPFIVRTTPTTIGGVNVPAGVYIQDAFIANGSISNAKIADATIDNAKIASLDAAKITTGFVSADRISAGSLDSKILTVESAKITGQLTANQINGANLAIRSGQYTGYNWPTTGGGFYLGPEGLLMGRYSATNPASTYFQFDSVTGAIYANGLSIVNGNTTFSGQLAVTSAASGSRLEITNQVIRVIDSAGVVRVKIGNLNA